MVAYYQFVCFVNSFFSSRKFNIALVGVFMRVCCVQLASVGVTIREAYDPSSGIDVKCTV